MGLFSIKIWTCKNREKKIVDSHSCQATNDHCHIFHATIDKNEIHVLKNRIDFLSSTFSNCAFNHSRLESLFQKKQVPRVHAHHPQHAYAHFARHDHTHTHMHPRVYKCTHCDRKDHLVKFC